MAQSLDQETCHSLADPSLLKAALCQLMVSSSLLQVLLPGSLRLWITGTCLLG